MARRMLAPLAGRRHRQLRETLETYLRFSGAKPAICEALYVYRNTLTQRLAKIEEMLGVDLQDGRTRATLLLALRLTSG